MRATLPHQSVIVLIVVSFLSACGAVHVSDASEGSAAPEAQVRIHGDGEYRLGFLGVMHNHPGIIVKSVEPDSPVTRMVRPSNPNVTGEMEPGDIVTHINGRHIHTFADYFGELSASGGEPVVLIVRDVRTGRRSEWRVTPVGGASSPTQLCVLLIGLTNDEKIGSAQAANLQQMKVLLDEEVLQDRIKQLETVEGDDCTAGNILRAARSLNPSPTDSVFCYFGGHGAFDPRHGRGDPSGGHFFQIPGGDLRRRDLWNALRSKPSRLTVLISDSCNIESRVWLRAVMHMRQYETDQPTALEVLLLHHRGVVDINSSSHGQYAWCDRKLGGWFTFVACDVFRNDKASDWETAFDMISEQANAVYLDRRNKYLEDYPAGEHRLKFQRQRSMTPQDFRLQVTRDKVIPKRPLAIRVRRTQVLVR